MDTPADNISNVEVATTKPPAAVVKQVIEHAQGSPQPTEHKRYMTIVNREITPPNPQEHKQCVEQGMKGWHRVDNCPVVNPWILSETELRKRAFAEHFCEEDVGAEHQSYKWRKAFHRKQQGKELDRVQAAWAELHDHERFVEEKLKSKEHSLSCACRERRIEEAETRFHDKYFGGYKRSRFDLVYVTRGPVASITIGVQASLDEPEIEHDDSLDTYLFPRK